MTIEERCVCCGTIIPEGRQVCPDCYGRAGRREQKMKKITVVFDYEHIKKIERATGIEIGDEFDLLYAIRNLIETAEKGVGL